MANISRECISIGADGHDRPSVLVVSTDEDRESFRSNLFVYDKFEGDAQIKFAEDLWISSMWKSPQGDHFLSEILGTCHWQVNGTFRSAKVSPHRLFKIWGLREDTVFVVGAEGRCFRYDGRAWADMSKGLSGFIHGIGGTSDANLYCVGDNGLLARWTGMEWEHIDIGTNADLRGVKVVGPDKLLVCGLDGIMLRLEGGIATEITGATSSLFAIDEFAGRIFVGSATEGAFVLQGDGLVPFKPQAKAYALSTSGRALWACGGNFAARFDGSAWWGRPYT